MSGLRTAIAGADEGYLTAFANKGLFKRAQRELPESGAAVSWEGDALRVSFADSTVVTITESIQSYSCTCPSRSVCKHLIMAVLAAQQEEAGGTGEGGEEAAPPPPADFSFVRSCGAKQLEKLAGKKHFRAAVFAVQLGEEAEIEETSTLAVTLGDTGHVVRFLPGAPLESASCSCKSAGFCAHRTQAVVQYIKHSKGALPEEFVPPEEEAALEFGTYTLPHIRAFVEEVFSTGLARMPEDIAGRFTQLATICHSQRLANMERLCSRIGGQLERYAASSAAFEPDYLMGDLCALLELCGRLEAGSVQREDVGVFREQYRPIPQVELLGLGAYGWRSTGGYLGVTTLFYAPSMAEVLTYTSAMPEGSVAGVDKLYGAGAPWGLPTKLSAIGHAVIQLRGGKLSGKGQLSSSEAATAQVMGSTLVMDPRLDALRFDDFGKLLEALWRHDEDLAEPMTALLLPARYGAADFDKITQRLTLPVYDEAERKVLLRVKYEGATRLLLENLMRMEEQEELTGPLLARVSIHGERLVAYPVTHFGKEPWNLSLDKEKKKASAKEKGWSFDWGS